MKRIALLGLVAILAAAPAFAHQDRMKPQHQGGLQVAGYITQSLATNAIDTLVVGPICVKALEGAAAADTTAASMLLQAIRLSFVSNGLAGTGGSGTGDSLQVAVDFSHGTVDFVQVSALGNLMTNALPTRTIEYKLFSLGAAMLKDVPLYVRFRYKNTGAATARFDVNAAWQIGDNCK